ncbi:MAG: hypothetical protein NTW86_05050 [Candidatus Sumerlaeota bacterium]|nr:hypothetical protein [Candidatus Sumerlaeota bacterium]
MNPCERFIATMQYQPRDRCPIYDFGFWKETLPQWGEQGYPTGAKPDDFFGMDPPWRGCGANTDLCPAFKEEVLEDRGETEIVRQTDGAVVERGKTLVSIPRHISHALRDRETWEKDFQWRMRPDDPARFPPEAVWKKRVAEWTRPDRDYPLMIGCGSLFGRTRNFMGMERVGELIYDDRKLFDEMAEVHADIAIATITKILEAGVRPEAASLWEDMCYNAGPLISPKVFKETLVPQYKRITNVLRKYGVDIVWVDCDGNIERLAPLWLEAGVNTMFPLEVGTWKADPIEYRRRYGKEMRIIGGVCKRMLATTPDAILREVERLTPLVEEGGFIPLCDHRVPPDVPLRNYVFYIEQAKRVWGKNLPNLRPTAAGLLR